nr:tyrosine-type recombinase/integrase [Pseudomonas moorei]
MNGKASESTAVNTARLFTWIMFETLKRPSQLEGMLKDALWVPDPFSNNQQYFLRIPKVKFQIGEIPELWPITGELAKAIQDYSTVPCVHAAQVKSNRLLITLRGGKNPKFGRAIKNWCSRLGLISPRTHKPLVLTPYRIRHSGATQMAAQGASSDEIQYILEHESVEASKAYIDCLASEFCPLLERVNRKLGGIFSELNGLFFVGAIGEKNSGLPILIPAVQQPAIVGGCGKNGFCGQHPFFNCYNGCRYFIAWRDADHQKSLTYLEGELARWGAAEGGKERSKVVKDLERVYQAVKDVVCRIDNGD